MAQFFVIVAAAILLATASEAAVIWNSTMFVNKNVSGVADGMIFVTSLGSIFGGFEAEIQAVDAATGLTAWNASNFGEQELPVLFYAFDNVPGVVFVFFNNSRPARLTAYDSRAGTVIWTVEDQAVRLLSDLLTSPDGSVLIAISRTQGPAFGLSIDRATGTLLAKKIDVIAPVYPLSCGSRGNCLATTCYIRNETTGWGIGWGTCLLDVTTGRPIANATQNRYDAVSIFGSGNVLLSWSADLLTRLDTETLSVLWTQIFESEISDAVIVAYKNATTGKPSQAVFLPGYSYVPTVLNLESGANLPSPKVSVTCPTGPPAPWFSASVLEQTSQFPYHTGYVASLMQCEYFTYPETISLDIYAVFNVANMTAPVWWRYASDSNANAFIRVSPERFLLINEYEQDNTSTADVYDDSFNPVARYTWSSRPTYDAQPLVGWATGGMAIIQQQFGSQSARSFYLSRVH